MALVSIHVYKTLPGKFVEHQAASAEAKERLQGLGLAAATITPIAGSDVGHIATLIQYDDNRSYTDAMQKVQSDPGWIEFYARVASGGSADLVETSLFSDVDPTYAPASDRPLGVMQTTQWRTKPGRLTGFMEHVAAAQGHLERLGGTVRITQSIFGKYPMTVSVAVTFEDLDHFGDFGDKQAADEQFTNYWAGVMADPTADLVRSGIYAIEV